MYWFNLLAADMGLSSDINEANPQTDLYTRNTMNIKLNWMLTTSI